MAPPRPKSSGPSLAALKSALAAKQAAEEEQRRLEQEAARQAEEAEKKRLEEEAVAEAARLAKKELKKEEARKAGKLLSKSEKERMERNRLKLAQLQQAGHVHVPSTTPGGVEEKKRPVYTTGRKKTHVAPPKESKAEPVKDDDELEGVLENWEAALGTSDSSSDEKEEQEAATDRDGKAEVEGVAASMAKATVKEQHQELRSPICCILGHVDTGKTKILDRIRQTNVQEGEAGGITQQIGATYIPIDAIRQKTLHLIDALSPKAEGEEDPFKVPGLLVIDTPGHASFTNLRSRGSSLCNIAILVVDIMHGLEPQTIESIGLLRQRKTPFIVALNKIDRLYGWQSIPDVSLEEAISRQTASVRAEYEERVGKAAVAFAEHGFNAALHYRNTDMRRCVSLVPTSAITGDGLPDLLFLLVLLTQRMMAESLRYLGTRLECTVLEVKVAEGLGTTIDVILANGVLREGDRIAVCGLNGPIVTTIRALLTPQPLRELRVKSVYQHHKRVKAALGVKICAPDLERAVAGSQLVVVAGPADEERAKAAVMQDLTAILDSVDKSGRGVCVQASTLGSLEALLAFLADSKIPVSGIGIGPVYRKDVTRASVMTESAKEYACILAFDVRIDRDAEELADELDVRIFRADIIYHLFDQFTAYLASITEQRKKDMAPQVIFPCVLRIVPGCVFNKRSPIIVGVEVVEGSLRVGTPLCVASGDTVTTLGRVTSIELNHRPMDVVRRGGPSVAIKIESAPWEAVRMFGRHFAESDSLMSRLTRASIDVLKESFREEVSKEEWGLIVKLKKVLSIA